MEKSSQDALEVIIENEDAFEAIDYLNKILCENNLELYYKYINYQARLESISKLVLGIKDSDIRREIEQLSDYKEEDRLFAIEYNEMLQAIENNDSSYEDD